MKSNHLAWLVGLSGLGLFAFAFAMHRRKQGFMGLGRGAYAQAPVVDGYSDGAMRTTLRAHPEMPLEQRIATIQELIHKSVQDPEMRKLALKITARCPERDKMCEAKAIYDAVKARVRYSGDVGSIMHPDGSVEGIDLYQSARRTWQFQAGDCDDQSILNSTLLALNGLTPMLRVVKSKRSGDWEHIMSGFTDTGRFVPLDTTLPGNKSFGVEPPYKVKVDFPA